MIYFLHFLSQPEYHPLFCSIKLKFNGSFRTGLPPVFHRSSQLNPNHVCLFHWRMTTTTRLELCLLGTVSAMYAGTVKESENRGLHSMLID